MNVFCLFLLVVGLWHSALAVWPETPFQAVSYLLRYGYLNPDYSMRTNPSKLLFYAVKNFQKKSMLNVTGKIDEFTLRQMQKKRCGVPDFSRETLKNIFLGPDIRITLSKRDATQAYWHKTDLTYHIKNYTPDLSKEATDETIKQALQVWADVSKLTFKQVDDDSADIVVEFVTGEHGDGVPFDGPGGTLAHAYFPETNMKPIEGDAHFDEDETWVLENNQNGTNLFCTAVHEFGHSIGLSHTYNSDDIMFPFETKCGEIILSENDIAAIQELYGKPDNFTSTTQSVTEGTTSMATTTLEETTEPTTVHTTPSSEAPTTTKELTTPSYSFTNVTSPANTLPTRTTNQRELTTHKSILPFPELCDEILNAINFGADGNVYVFIELLVFVFGSHGIGQNYYTLIYDIFPGAPSTIDTAFTVNAGDYNKNGHANFTYLIKGHLVWKYYFHYRSQRFQLAVGYPKHKLKDFPHSPSFVQTAFYTDGKTYLLDRDSYIEYNYNCERSTFESLTSIRPIHTSKYFRNLPKDTSVDAVYDSGIGYLNVLAGKDWYIVDPTGDIREIFKTATFFGCDVAFGPDGQSHHGHKHSHHGHKHSHRGHKHSHHGHKKKHSHKKHKKSPKRDKHRRKSPRKKGKH